MRALTLLVVVGLAPIAFVGASAYQAAEVEPRAIVVTVSGDAAAYLSVAANSAHAFDCLVAQEDGALAIRAETVTSGCAFAGGGTGVNAGDGTTSAKYSRYAFHDLILVTNKGTRAVNVWLNATTTSAGGSEIHLARKTTSGTMTDADYAASSATPLSLGVGSVGYVGVRLKSGTLTAGNEIVGTVDVVARRQ